MLAVLCPRDNVVGLLSEDRESVSVVGVSIPPVKLSVGELRQRYPGSTIQQVESEDEAISALGKLRNKTTALDFTLLLIDAGTSPSTRTLASECLNTLLAEPENRNFVLDIILAAPLPADADMSSALECCLEPSSKTRALLSTIKESQDRVIFARQALEGLRMNPMAVKADVYKVYSTLLRNGVVRELVEGARNQGDVDLLLSDLAVRAGSECDARIVIAFINDYKAALPAGKATRPNGVPRPVMEVDSNDDARAIEGKLPPQSSHAALQSATKQVQRIADLYRVGNDTLANSYFNDLLEQQTKNTSDHSHAVKSICNIASQCTTAGRRQVSLELLKVAMTYTSGVDAVLYTQIGDELRRNRSFDEALECYYKAINEPLKADFDVDRIRRKVIAIESDKGNYDNALKQYYALPIKNARIYSAIGTLHRRMGDLLSARRSYFEAIRSDSRHYPAHVGLAEAKKQTGKLHDAIGKYKVVFKQFTDIAEAEKKIYQLAMSHLYRMTGQYARARDCLQQLSKDYPLDGDINLQLAKVLMLQGETNLANEHFARVEERANSLIQLGMELFELATGKSTAVTSTDASIVQLGSHLPENRGLARCKWALNAILQNDFESAWKISREGRYVDRIHADFAEVISYHAMRHLDPATSARTYPLSRVAKRGHPQLRKAIVAINNRQFDDAVEYEKKMCLLV